MPTFNMQTIMEEAEREGGGSSKTSDWFKIKDGSNRLRLLSVLVPYASHYNFGACLGKEKCPICKEDSDSRPSIKFLANVLDYVDGEIKIAQFPYTIAKAVQDYQNDPDYAFDSAPMPYDITIKAEGAGTKEVKYTVIASPKTSEVPMEIMAKLEKRSTPEHVKEALKRRKEKELGLAEKTVEPLEYPKNEGNMAF
jgi:hypothetical protein